MIEPLAPKFNSLIQNNNGPQECIPVGCLLSAGKGGGLPNPPGCRPSPWMQTPLEAESPFPTRQIPLEADPPRNVTCDVWWEANPPPLGQKTRLWKYYLAAVKVTKGDYRAEFRFVWADLEKLHMFDVRHPGVVEVSYLTWTRSRCVPCAWTSLS